VAIFFAVGCHEQAIALVPVLALAALFARDRSVLAGRGFVLGLAGAALVWGALLWLSKADGPGTLVALRLGAMPDKAFFLGAFRAATPFGTSLLLLTGVVLSSSDPRLDRRLWLYAASIFAVSLLLVSLLSPWETVRYALHLHPLFVVLAAAAGTWCVRRLAELIRARSIPRASPRLALAVACAACAILHAATLENVRIVSGFGHGFRSPDQKPAHDVLAERLRPGEVVVTTEPGLTRFYLGQSPDFFLRERYDRPNLRFVPFSAEAKQRSSVPVLDRPEDFEALLAGPRRVWLYANHKLTFTTSRAMQEVVARHFQPVHGWKEHSGSVLFVREPPAEAASR
jgi:hypothetical protein